MKYLKSSLLFVLILAFTACGTSTTSDSYDTTAEEAAMVEESVTNQSENNQITNPENRKIIVRYSLDFDTDNYDEGLNEINNLVDSLGGYHSSMNINSSGNRYLDMTVHIPKDNVNEFINTLSNSENLNLLNQNLNSEDVTAQYTDTDLRLTSLRQKLERLNELQDAESDLEQLLLLENEITDTIFEIERIEGELNSIDSKIDYTEISIYVSEVGISDTSSTRLDFGKRLSAAFGDSITNFVAWFQDFIIGIIYALPMIILLLIVFFVVRFIYSKLSKRERKPRREREYRFRRKENIDNKKYNDKE